MLELSRMHNCVNIYMTELSTRLEPKSAIISIHNHGLLTRLVIGQDS